MAQLFAVAGNETLRNGLPGACIALLEHPQAQDELRADPARLALAADEMLRWWTPVMTFRRTAGADCELGGRQIRAGDKVVVSFTSANRDDAVFADPDQRRKALIGAGQAAAAGCRRGHTVLAGRYVAAVLTRGIAGPRR